jgi:predicted Zn-dependent protease
MAEAAPQRQRQRRHRGTRRRTTAGRPKRTASRRRRTTKSPAALVDFPDLGSGDQQASSDTASKETAPPDGVKRVEDPPAKGEPVRLKAGVLLVHMPESDPKPLQRLVDQVVKHAEGEIEAATGAAWEFAVPLPRALDESGVHREGDFLSKAMTTMAEGMLDLVIVVTDAPLSARDKAMVYGSHSRTARVAVLSTRRLLEGDDADAERGLESPGVVRNAQALFLHLLGHLMGVVHQWEQGNVMAPFRFQKDRDEPHYTEAQRQRFKKKARKLPDQKVAAAGPLMAFVFHMMAFFRNPGEVLLPLLRPRAFLLPLQMPSMATAALIPTIVLVFTAEIWDVAFHMRSATAYGFAIAVVLLGSLYLAVVQDLFFPRKERETLTEHAAVVNTVLWISMLQALVGLFIVIGLFVWALETYVFPEALMAKWTGIEGVSTQADRLRLAIFISTLGTMTAAMGAALDRKVVVRNLALFSDRA